MKGLEMSNEYLNIPDRNDLFDEPSDEELKRIEKELEKYSN